MVRIRPARLSDIDDLVRLRVALLREVGNVKDDASAREVADANRRYLAEKLPAGEFLAWVAEADGKVIAISGLVLFERPPVAGNLSGMEGYVLNMYSVPEWRHQGIATALLSEIVRFAKSTNARRLWLKATPAGKSVYEKAGFRPIADRDRTSATTEMELIW